MAKKQQLNVAVACGGTGGHLFPGLAVAEQLRAEGHNVLVLVSKKDVDQHAAELGGGLEVVRIPAVGLPRRKVSFEMIPFIVKLFASIIRCQWLYRRHRTTVVLGMGGFTSAAAVIAAQWLFLPTVVHESNSIPGKANRRAARRAKFVACGFEDCVARFPNNKGVWTGTPVRSSLETLPKYDCVKKLELDPAKPTVLIMGGSQGAHAINEAAWNAGPRLKEFNVIHLTGTADFPLAKELYDGAEANVSVHPFLDEMQVAYSAADLVVSRAGAASLTEIAHYRLPSILIPYPLAAENHQQRNAELFARGGAAEILPQDALKPEKLAASIQSLWKFDDRRRRMSEKVAHSAKPNAVTEVVTLLKRAAGMEPTDGNAEVTA